MPWGSNPTVVMPTVGPIIRLIFAPSNSIASYMVANTRPRHFAVLLKSYFPTSFEAETV